VNAGALLEQQFDKNFLLTGLFQKRKYEFNPFYYSRLKHVFENKVQQQLSSFLHSYPNQINDYSSTLHGEKNGFATATKLGTTIFFLFLQPKILLQQPNFLLTELNILLQSIFVIPILTNDFVGITKPFIPCFLARNRKTRGLCFQGKTIERG